MKNSEICRKAAELVLKRNQEYTYCCPTIARVIVQEAKASITDEAQKNDVTVNTILAIEKGEHEQYNTIIKRFEYMFKPERKGRDSSWWLSSLSSSNQFRSLALIMTAEWFEQSQE
jgi:hypothetical protein